METKQKLDFWSEKPAEEINDALKTVPIAKEVKLTRNDHRKTIKEWKAIVVDDEIVNIPTDKYVLVQTEQAVRPVIDGLTVSGIQDFKFNIWSTTKRINKKDVPVKTNLSITVGEANDSVRFGFRVTNSFNATRKVGLGYSAIAEKEETEVEIVEREYVTLWGFRQTCANGMIMKIPLKSEKYLDTVTRTTVKTLFAKQGYKDYVHSGKNLTTKIKEMQYVVEALLLMRPALNRMIEDAQATKLTPEQVSSIMEKYIGKRKHDDYLENFNEERGNDLWSLYNSLTWYASHKDLSSRQREKMLNKAGTMLAEVLVSN